MSKVNYIVKSVVLIILILNYAFSFDLRAEDINKIIPSHRSSHLQNQWTYLLSDNNPSPTRRVQGKSVFDSLTKKDSIYKSIEQDSSKIKSDSIQFYTPIINHGNVSLYHNKDFRTINKRDLEFLEYNSFSEILTEKTPSFPLFLGNPAMFNSASLFAGNNVAVNFNNRPILDLEYSSFNLDQMPTEFFENAEVIVGSDAVIYSDNTDGTLINFQEINYNTKIPFTRLWYSQGGYDFLSGDGVYSQNILPNLNYTFGFRRQSGNGRYEKSWIDSWNVRNLVRWNISRQLNISLVENFTNHGLATNGGLNTETSTDITDPIYANSYYPNLNERVFRHDLTLSASSYITKDSSTSISSNIFLSNSQWIRNLSDNLLGKSIDSTRRNTHISKYYGFNLKLEQNIKNIIFLSSGIESYYADMEQAVFNPNLSTTSLSAFARGQMNLFDFIVLSGGLRYRRFGDFNTLNYGTKAIFKFNNNSNFLFDFSQSQEIPPAFAMNIAKNTNNILALSEFSYSGKSNKFALGAYYKSIDNQIEFHDIDNNSINFSISQSAINKNYWGTYIEYKIQLIDNLFLAGKILFNSSFEKSNQINFPEIYSTMKTYYQINRGNSILKLGLSGSIISSYTGKKFLPQYRNYIQYDNESGLMNDGIKVFALARLGNAFIKASFENILSQNYYYVPLYPMYDRNFRFSFSWSFLN